MGEKNERGNALIEFVLEEGLCIFNRHMDMSHVNDTWKCSRSNDGRLVPVDFVLGVSQFFLDDVRYDFGFPVGLDHRCVHCKLRCVAGTRDLVVALAQQHGLNTWFEQCLKHHCLKCLAVVLVRLRDPRH